MVDDGFDLLYEYRRHGNMLVRTGRLFRGRIYRLTANQGSYLAIGVSPERYTQLAWLSLYSSRVYGIATTSESISITDEDLKREAFNLHLWLDLCASDFEGVFPPSLYNLLNNLDGRNRIPTRETVLYNDIVPYLRATRYPFARLSQPESPTLVREPFILARLEGKTVSTFPDTGATANFLSIRCAQQHGFKRGSHIGEKIKVGNGALANVLGAITLPLSFRGEAKVHQVEFKVLANCVHDVVLGSPFLKLTQTLSRLKDRIQQRVRKVFRHNRVCSLGSHQYVDGRLNGFDVSAVPDTGADVSVMSASFAKRHEFHVDTSERNRIILEFADGSSATTMGVVKSTEWEYGSAAAGSGDRLDVYVLEGLAEDVILSYDFLSATDAFVKYESDFWTNDGEDDLGVDWIFNIIKLVSKVLRRSTASGTDSSKSPAAPLPRLTLPMMLTLHRQRHPPQTPRHTLPIPP